MRKLLPLTVLALIPVMGFTLSGSEQIVAAENAPANISKLAFAAPDTMATSQPLSNSSGIAPTTTQTLSTSPATSSLLGAPELLTTPTATQSTFVPTARASAPLFTPFSSPLSDPTSITRNVNTVPTGSTSQPSNTTPPVNNSPVVVATTNAVASGSNQSGDTTGGSNQTSTTFGSTSTTLGNTTTTYNSTTSTANNNATSTSNNNTTTSQQQTTSTAQETTTTAQQTTTTAAQSGGRQLVYSEEFNSLNNSTWREEHSTYGDGNNELQCYDPSNVSVANGKLKLVAKKEAITCPGGRTRQYSSGMVRSSGLTFSPGQSIEYSVKLTPNDEVNQSGLWPAFWSSSWGGGGWPRGGEWDGFEVMTARSAYRTVFSIHYLNTNGVHGKKTKEQYNARRFSNNWHTMRFDYGHNGVLTWYMDGYLMKQITDADTVQGWPMPFDQSMTQFKINLALGGSPGPLDDRALPATYEVDYVRIYNM